MKLKAIIAAMLVVTGMASCHRGGADYAAADMKPRIDVAMPIVDSVTLHRSIPGYIVASSFADVVARVSGTVLEQKFQSGSYVTAGQPLFIIESSSYADAVKQAEASLATAKSQYDYYSKQYDAMQRALAKQAVSAIETEQVRSNMEQARAAIANAEAALHTARTNLGYCTVRAPISGHITLADHGQGSFVDGGVQPVKMATVYADKVMEAAFNIESAQYEEMIGENGGIDGPLYRNVPLEFEAPLSHTYTTDLYYTAPAVDQNTGTLVLRGYIDNKEGELKSGMYLTVSLPYGIEPHAILVRDASIGTDQLGKYVYVVDDSCRVVYTPIKVGELYQDSLRIVESGLKSGDRYVTKALLTVRNGELVEPVMADD